VANPYYGRVTEQVVNVKLAEILSESFGIDARAERAKGRRRPDIRCYYRGLIIGIEASYSKSDAEKDAMRRIEEGLVDIALALWLKRSYPDVPESELKKIIKKSRFDVKVFVPEDVIGPLIPYLEETLKRRAEPATGWFTDVDLPMIKTILESSISFLIREEEVQQLLEEMKLKISDFTKSLIRIDEERTKGGIRRKIYDILYRLYGLSVAEAEDPEIAFGQTALSILLSTTFYEHIRSRHSDLLSISEYVHKYGYLEGPKRAFEGLLRINYRTAVETTIKLLNVLPPDIILRVKDLVDLGIKIASNKSLLKRDFAGRVYHEITGDIALRKGFATFYTEVPSAYLLATLATEVLLGLDKKSIMDLSKEEAKRIIDCIKKLNIGDLACGSGTLLTASYYSLMRIASALKYYYDLDVGLEELGKKLIEKHIYGIDALKYASQITAINLALIGPSAISKENIYTIYLGYIPEKDRAWLGSLELFNNGKKVGTLLAWLEGWYEGGIERVSVEGVEGEFLIPEKFDMIIMNPPFTRATGRTARFEEAGAGRGLFGFIADERARQRLLEAYREVRDSVRSELTSITVGSANVLPDAIRGLVLQRPKELQQYLAIGQAGEGLLFLHLAYKYIDDGGVIAFVLPRGVLAGVSWLLARILLASKFHVKYIVVSSDPKRGYNFSEGAALSETLIVAMRADKHRSDEETIFINLLHKPLTALEAIMLAEEIKRKALLNDITLAEVGDSKALIFKVRRDQLLDNIDNWNRFVAISDIELLNLVVHQLLENNMIEINDYHVKVPITRFNNIIDTLGIDRHQFHDHFRRVETVTLYPIVYGGGEEVRKRMLVQYNAYAFSKTDRAKDLFRKYSGKILVPDRIRWNTAHVTALYSQEPILSNIFYAVKLKVPSEIKEYSNKALVLWFNTTWGLLTILISRQETEGAWSSLKMAQWRLLPVLDISSLDIDTLRRLAETFDRYASRVPKRIPHQFNPKNPDPVRLGIDMEFLKTFRPELKDEEVKASLLELYKYVDASLKLWIKG